jgi:hypothetical protein
MNTLELIFDDFMSFFLGKPSRQRIERWKGYIQEAQMTKADLDRHCPPAVRPYVKGIDEDG